VSIAGKLGAIAAFWIAVGLIQTFNWGHGGEKAAVMLVLLVSIPALVARAERGPEPLPSWLHRGVAIAASVCLALDIVYLGLRIVHPHLIDVATTSLAAGQAILHGANPYALPLDRGPEAAGFTGYKYLPVMIAAYLPLGALWGERGVLLTNLAILVACLWCLRRLTGSMLAPLLFVMLPLVAEQIFAKGATDLAPVLLLLLAFLAVERKAFLAGLCVGLSIAAKPLPGLAFLPALIPANGRAPYALGIGVGLVPILPFLWLSPGDLIANIVTFNLSRAPDATSWLFGAPALAAAAVRAVLAMLFAGALVYVWRGRPSLPARCGIGAMLALATLLAGPGAHHNYQLWWLPFYAISLALALAPQEACQGAPLRYTNRAAMPSKRL
jgi:hypothetical protein